jgi:hypothetical protein
MKERIIRKEDLSEILTEIASYIESTDESSLMDYFNEIVKTGVFHDAIGEVVHREEDSVTTINEY